VTDGGLSILVEACVDSVASSRAAERGGARRLELCDALFDGGTTPSAGMIAACKASVSIPVVVMIRPRGGGFVYSDAERDVMRRDIIVARELGADGVVIGGLRPDGTIDLELVHVLVEGAHELPVTFHRAFDLIANQTDGLEQLIDAGVGRVLTSGGANTALEGAPRIAALVNQSRGRLGIIAGGGVRENNVREIISLTGVEEVHARIASIVCPNGSPRSSVKLRKRLPDNEGAWEELDESRMRDLVTQAG